MNKKFNKMIFFTTVTILLIFSILFIVLPKKEFSENENRYLERFPKITLDNIKSGKFTSSLESYVNDHFPLRDTFLKLKVSSDVFLNKNEISDIYITDDYLISKFKKENDTNKLIKTINTFNKYSNSNNYLMIVPSSVGINDNLINTKEEDFDNGLSSISDIYDSSNLTNIDVYNTLKEHNKDFQIYYRTDHHWTTYGAYFAYKEFINNDVNLDSYKIVKESDSFYGTSYSSVPLSSIKPDVFYLFYTDTSYIVTYVNEDVVTDTLYNKDYLNKKDKYSTFLDNNHALIKIHNNDNTNHKSIMIVKNSYGNSFVPFITEDYEDVYVIDLRYYKGSVSEYVNENNIEDTLILYDINGLYTDSSIFKLK